MRSLLLMLFLCVVIPCSAVEKTDADFEKRITVLEVREQLWEQEKAHMAELRRGVQEEVRQITEHADRQLVWMGVWIGILTLISGVLSGFLTFVTYKRSAEAEQARKEAEAHLAKIEFISDKTQNISSEIEGVRDQWKENLEEFKKRQPSHEESISEETQGKAKKITDTSEALIILRAFSLEASANKNKERAYELWKLLLTKAPNDVEGLSQIVLVLLSMAKDKREPVTPKILYDEAEGYLRKISEKEQSSWGLNVWALLKKNRGESTNNLNERHVFWNEADQMYKEATNLMPEDDLAWSSWGGFKFTCALYEGNEGKRKSLIAEAESMYRKALELTSKNVLKNASILIDLGAMRSLVAQYCRDPQEIASFYSSSDDAFCASERLNPNSIRLWEMWGGCLYGRAETAKTEAEKAEWFAKAAEKYRKIIEIV